MARIKVHELHQKNKADLLSQLKDLKTELALLRVAQKAREVVDRSEVLTVISQKQKAALRDAYEEKKLLPLNSAPKKPGLFADQASDIFENQQREEE